MKMTTRIIVGVIVFLLAMISYYGFIIVTQKYNLPIDFSLNPFRNNEVTLLSEGRTITPEVKDGMAQYNANYWKNHDTEATISEIQALLSVVQNKNAGTGKPTAQNIKEEALLHRDLGITTLQISQDEGLRILAEVFNSKVYSNNVRSVALYEAMLYASKQIRNGEMSVEDVKAQVLSDARFGGAVNITSEVLLETNTLTEAHKLVIAGLFESSKLTTSNKWILRSATAAHTAELFLRSDEANDAYVLDGGISDDFPGFINANIFYSNYFDEKLTIVRELNEQLVSAMSNHERYPEYTIELSQTANHLMDAYLYIMDTRGSTYTDIGNLYTESNAYLDTYRGTQGSDAYQVVRSVFYGQLSMYQSCAYVLHTQGEVWSVRDREDLTRYLQGMYAVPEEKTWRILDMVRTEKSVCYDPLIRLRELFPDLPV